MNFEEALRALNDLSPSDAARARAAFLLAIADSAPTYRFVGAHRDAPLYARPVSEVAFDRIETALRMVTDLAKFRQYEKDTIDARVAEKLTREPVDMLNRREFLLADIKRLEGVVAALQASQSAAYSKAVANASELENKVTELRKERDALRREIKKMKEMLAPMHEETP